MPELPCRCNLCGRAPRDLADRDEFRAQYPVGSTARCLVCPECQDAIGNAWSFDAERYFGPREPVQLRLDQAWLRAAPLEDAA